MRVLLGCLVAFLLAPSVASAAGEAVFFELPPATHAHSMAAGPEEALWFTGEEGRFGPLGGGGVVGRVSAAGQVDVFRLPPNRFAGSIAAGRDGNLWFPVGYEDKRGERVARLGRMSPDGAFEEYRLGNRPGGLKSVAAGPGGSIWFTAEYWVDGRQKATVGRVDASGRVARFHLPPRSRPGDIVTGPDGNLWFGQRGEVPKIGRITPAGRITHFPLPDRAGAPTSIVAGPDGSLWFGQRDANYLRDRKRVGRITTTGAITEFRVPGDYETRALTSARGRIWFTTQFGQGAYGIGSIAVNGAATRPECLSATRCEIDADTLTVGADGALWFAASKFHSNFGGGGSGIAATMAEESEAGLVGRYLPPPAG